jgi:cytochrome c oxidase subunit 4
MNPEPSVSQTSIRLYCGVYLLLLGLLALTIWTATLSLGRGNAPAACAIAGVKALLVVWYFMQARSSGRMIGLVIVAACLWLGLLVGLTLSDFLTRSWL